MQKIKKFVIHNLVPVTIFVLLILPALSLAQVVDKDIPDPGFPNDTLIPCGHEVNGVITNPCSFNDALVMINAIIKFILFKLAVPVAAVMFFYAGVKMVTSGGSPESRGMAKNIFTNTAIGLFIAAGAFIIINTILTILGYDGSWIGFN